ncbi:MAG: nicotinate phosphoribosyltransferase [Acidimicrobiales bacterium]
MSPGSSVVRALSTDLYEIKMAASYLRRGMKEPATFSLFIRRIPSSRGYLVAAGLEDCLSYLENLRFDPDELEYLSRIGFDDRDLESLAALRFTGEVRAIPEGRVVLANEPLLEVTAPIAEAQLVETYLLNQITFQTAMASKAARCVTAAGEIELFDFALRRTHGIEAADALARLCAIAGFKGTSNVSAACHFGLTAVGTMAHSYIEAFAKEEDAFRAFAEDFPERSVFLVDTYDTPTGVDRAAELISRLRLHDTAVRIDSGDLARLSREARRRLDAAGLNSTRVFVSGGVDEHALERFVADHDPIDAAGIGVMLGVSYDAPTLDSAYKLVEIDGRPTMKLSPERVNLPGAKQLWRSASVFEDILGVRDETGPVGGEALLGVVMQGGKRVGEPDSIKQAADRLQKDLARLPEEARRVRSPIAPSAAVSVELTSLADRVADTPR